MPDLYTILFAAARIIAFVIIASALLQTIIYFAQLVLAAWTFARRPVLRTSIRLWNRFSEVAPPIAIVVPAYNEELNVVQTARSLLSIEYPNFEVIIVNDGSSDRTLELLLADFGLERVERPYEPALDHAPIRGIYANSKNSQIVVVDKENGGKADAQNAGVNVARAPLFCIIDADSILEQDALLRVVQPFIDDPRRTIAVGGTIRIANNCVVDAGRVEEIRLPQKLVPLFQVVEYLRSFLMARLAWSQVGALMLISGAFGVFRRDVAVEVGGYHSGSLGEDLDMIMKLHKHMIESDRPYRIEFLPEPICWTEAPETLKVLGRQRSRWQRGALECFFRYRRMFLNPRYGRIGIFGMGHMFVVDVLGPVAEVLGYLLIPLFWMFGVLNTEFLLAFTALVFVYGVFISVGSLVLEEMELRRFPRARDLAILTLIAVVENFGYRQWNNVWRVRGVWQYFRSDSAWGEMTRTGLGSRTA